MYTFRSTPLHTLPNCRPADNEVIQDLITALRSGSENAQQQGTLMALIAQTKTAYTCLHGVTGTQLIGCIFIINKSHL
jgi:hypothetical protein